MRKCNCNCVSICGFCSKYNINDKICMTQNMHKEKYEDCNCNKFKCFTLEYYYNKNDYLNINYIKNLYEGRI